MYKFKTKCNKFEEGVYEPFVYIIEELETGMLYIGSRTAMGCKVADMGVNYFTSSLLVKDSWRDDRASFRVVQTHTCDSNHHALILEYVLIKVCDAVSSDQYLNRAHPYLGFNMSGVNFTEDHKKKLRGVWDDEKRKEAARRTQGLWTPEARKMLSERMSGTKNPEHSERMRGKNNPYYSKTHSREVRDKISDAVLSSRKEECEHCQRVFSASRYEKYHGDNCEWKGCSQEEINLIKHMASTKLAKRKYNFKKWLDKNPEFKEHFTFFDYLKIGMVEMNKKVREGRIEGGN